MTPDVYQKKPREQRLLVFDYYTALAPGDTLTGTPVLTVTPSGELSVPAAAIASGGQKVNARIAGGVDGKDYDVLCECGTTAQDTLGLLAVIEVRAREN